MTRVLVVLLALAALLVVAAPAGAVEPLTLKSSTPADGGRVPLTPTGGVPWQIAVTGVPDDASVSVTVSSTGATGPDGVTLSTGDRVDFFFLSGTGTPGGWSGRSDPGPNAWSGSAGTYHWQVIATWTDTAGVFHSAAGKVERLLVGAGPPAATQPAPSAGTGRRTLRMSSADATFYVRSMIRLRTKRAPARLRSGCARVAARTFRCRPTWRDRRNTYTATASFTHVRSGGRVVTRAAVSGRRASLQCVRQRSFARCATRFRWRATLAARP